MEVAPLTGSVDRNGSSSTSIDFDVQVAPLTGSVDRNISAVATAAPTKVAPLTGSVDRNLA